MQRATGAAMSKGTSKGELRFTHASVFAPWNSGNESVPILARKG